MKKVMTFGTFDIFHPGHIHYLWEASKLGSSMTVVIARDARVEKLKWRAPQDDENLRKENVGKAFPNAKVILGDEEDIFAPLYLHKPDILVFGYDQRVPIEKIHELFPDIVMEKIGGFETEKWKSSKLRQKSNG